MNNGVLGATAACGRDPDVSAHVSALAPSVTGVDACSRSWKVEPEGGGRLFVETCSFRINVFIFEGDNVSPRAANSLRPENASFRVLYCRSGKKYIFTTGGVRLLVVARVFPVISEKDVTKHLGNGAFRVGFKMEMVRFGWEKGSRKLPYRAAYSLRPRKRIVPCTLLRVRKKISFYHLGCQTLVVARVS